MLLLILVMLSFDIIDALIPVIIVLILIAAAAGITRGMDMFALFGLGSLMGFANSGGGRVGKGLKGVKYGGSSLARSKAASKAKGGIRRNVSKARKELKKAKEKKGQKIMEKNPGLYKSPMEAYYGEKIRTRNDNHKRISGHLNKQMQRATAKRVATETAKKVREAVSGGQEIDSQGVLKGAVAGALGSYNLATGVTPKTGSPEPSKRTYNKTINIIDKGKERYGKESSKIESDRYKKGSPKIKTNTNTSTFTKARAIWRGGLTVAAVSSINGHYLNWRENKLGNLKNSLGKTKPEKEKGEIISQKLLDYQRIREKMNHNLEEHYKKRGYVYSVNEDHNGRKIMFHHISRHERAAEKHLDKLKEQVYKTVYKETLKAFKEKGESGKLK